MLFFAQIFIFGFTCHGKMFFVSQQGSTDKNHISLSASSGPQTYKMRLDLDYTGHKRSFVMTEKQIKMSPPPSHSLKIRGYSRQLTNFQQNVFHLSPSSKQTISE